MLVVAAVDVYVEVAADDDRAVVDSELFEHRRQMMVCMRPSWGFLQIVQNWAQDGADECLVDSGHVGAGGHLQQCCDLERLYPF